MFDSLNIYIFIVILTLSVISTTFFVRKHYIKKFKDFSHEIGTTIRSIYDRPLTSKVHQNLTLFIIKYFINPSDASLLRAYTGEILDLKNTIVGLARAAEMNNKLCGLETGTWGKVILTTINNGYYSKLDILTDEAWYLLTAVNELTEPSENEKGLKDFLDSLKTQQQPVIPDISTNPPTGIRTKNSKPTYFGSIDTPSIPSEVLHILGIDQKKNPHQHVSISYIDTEITYYDGLDTALIAPAQPMPFENTYSIMFTANQLLYKRGERYRIRYIDEKLKQVTLRTYYGF